MAIIAPSTGYTGNDSSGNTPPTGTPLTDFASEISGTELNHISTDNSSFAASLGNRAGLLSVFNVAGPVSQIDITTKSAFRNNADPGVDQATMYAFIRNHATSTWLSLTGIFGTIISDSGTAVATITGSVSVNPNNYVSGGNEVWILTWSSTSVGATGEHRTQYVSIDATYASVEESTASIVMGRWVTGERRKYNRLILR